MDAGASRTTPKGKAARDLILSAATQLFAEKGIRGATITEIAAAAGVNRAMISYYFGNKDALYDAIIDAAVADAAETLAAADFDASSKDALRELVMTLAEMLGRRRFLGKMVMREYLEPGRLFNPSTANRLGGFMALTEKVLRTAPLSKRARDYDPQVVHLIVVGALNYFILTEPFRSRLSGKLDRPLTQPTLAEFADTLADIFSIGLNADSD